MGERSFSKSWGLRASGSFFPLPLPRHSFFFCSCPSFLDEPREETLAMQASCDPSRSAALLLRIKALALQKRPLLVLLAVAGRTTTILDVAVICTVEGSQCKTRDSKIQISDMALS